MFEEVTKLAIPTKEEEKKILSRASAFIEKLQKKLPQTRISLGGSVAKGTWLKKDLDIDIFVAFPTTYRGKDLSSLIEKKVPEMEKVHGSRDYFSLQEEDITFEVIPILDVKKASEAENITDVSPLHANWVKKQTNQKIRDEIRITKLFLQANKLYGAESFIRGFSGYVIELLIIHYGGFEKLLKEMSKWKKPVVIDVMKHHKDVFFEVNESKLQSPIIVIDPIQPGRNASAAVSCENFEKCIGLAKKYLKSPREDYFLPQKISDKKKKDTLLIQAIPLDNKRDVAGCKLLKVHEFIARTLTQQGFTIKKKDWEWSDKAVFMYELDSLTISQVQTIKGPPESMSEHAKIFKKKYKSTSVKKGILYGERKRRFTKAKDCISYAINLEYVKTKVKEIVLT